MIVYALFYTAADFSSILFEITESEGRARQWLTEGKGKFYREFEVTGGDK